MCEAFVDGMPRTSSPTWVWWNITPRREVSTCAYATMSDRVMREMSEHLFCLSSFREGDGAAMCRRPPRGWLDIVGANAPTTSASGSRGVPHGVRSTHLFPRSGIQWRLFLGSVFFAKKRNSTRWIGRYVRTNGDRRRDGERYKNGRGDPSPTVVKSFV